jgi:asparagine synthase (glutamine-hydrolysing)
MCGIAGILNSTKAEEQIQQMLLAQKERGPDAKGVYLLSERGVAFGHNRLSIIDLSSSANQPMHSQDGRYIMVFNGEIYNYIELKQELKPFFNFRTESDSEVLLCAYIHWGSDLLDRLNGMFAFTIYDTVEGTLFLARDRFGVKPLYYSLIGNTLIFASEIKSIHASGLIEKESNDAIWSLYFAKGLYDHSEKTFWKNVFQLPAGAFANYEESSLKISKWYSVQDKIQDVDTRNEKVILEELLYLLETSINYRFRADVPVGICLSGGLDSSLLLALVNRVKGKDFPIHAFTFYTDDSRYDELPWVNQMLEGSSVKHHPCLLEPSEIPDLSQKISRRMDEPFGGIPTLGMSKVFECAQRQGIKVLLDGNGMDEGWGGYDYYQRANSIDFSRGPVQGSKSSNPLEGILKKEALQLMGEFELPKYHSDSITNLQIRDLVSSKIPRSMRFADRNSMTYSLELREPFLDYRLIELGLRQLSERKIKHGDGKYLIRKLASQLIPKGVCEAPKRPLQTPQREWLASIELKFWTENLVCRSRTNLSRFINYQDIEGLIRDYSLHIPTNSFYMWQLINYCLLNEELFCDS